MVAESLLHQVVDLSKEVAAFIRREGVCFDVSRVEHKSSFRDLVSYVDKEAEQRIMKGLVPMLKGASFLAEESGEKNYKIDYQWIIDPLDGTTNFTHGLPPYAISIALAKQNKIVLGVVYEVTRSECFCAVRGGGAYCNDEPIRVSPASSLCEVLLATGFPYLNFERREDYMSIIKDFLDQSQGIRRMGSAAVDLSYVACGRLGGFFEYGLQPWDVAAGGLIVEEAGGVVTAFSKANDYLFGSEICASATAIHPEMMHIIEKQWLTNQDMTTLK